MGTPAGSNDPALLAVQKPPSIISSTYAICAVWDRTAEPLLAVYL
jgi:hypothetical protein